MKKYIDNLLQKNGPEENDYDFVNNLIVEVERQNKAESFRKHIAPILNMSTLFGHSYLKPYGYAGDFLIIDRIYQKYVSSDSIYSKWDLFYHSLGASRAVRNRKSYFVEKLHSIRKKGGFKILILASGPATDVFEYLCNSPDKSLHFHLLDFDKRAIDYAKDKNCGFKENLTYITANALKFNTTEKYDLIWSAGLFDYFNDKVFLHLLKSYKKNLSEHGEMIIGNFSTANPTKSIMEVVSKWFLNYRDENLLFDLACKAGVRKECICIEKEPLGVNLFLKINQRQ